MRTAILLTICVILSSVIGATAQTFVPIRSDLKAFPAVKTTVYAFDATGAPQTLAAGDVTVTENGQSITANTVCEQSSAGRRISLLVSLDISASTTTGSPTNLDIMKNAARVVTGILASTSDEIGLSVIDAQPTLLYGLSTDKVAYISEVDNVRSSGGLKLAKGLTENPLGSLVHLQNSSNGRALLLITDGSSSLNARALINSARTFGIRVYVICVRAPISTDLGMLADSSGGAWVDQVTTVAEAQAWARGFVADAKMIPACNVNWTAGANCTRDRAVAFSRGATTRQWRYQTPASTRSELEASTLGLDYGTPAVGQLVSRTLTLTARNREVRVSGISTSSSAYQIVNLPTIPMVVPKDQTLSFDVRYNPATTDGVFGTLLIMSDACVSPSVVMRGGSALSGDKLRLKSPNGGETFTAGIDTAITWENVLPSTTVSLEYTIDGGASWRTITETGIGLSHAWRPGPVVSQQVRVRVSQTVISPDDIAILRGSQQPVYAVAFTDDGRRVLTGGHDGTVRLWNIASGQQERLIGLHGNWVWSVAAMPNSPIVASASHDGTVRIWNYETGDRVATIPVDGRAWSLAFSADASQLYVGTDKGVVVITTGSWTTFTNNVVDLGPVYSLSLSSDGTLIGVAEGNKATVRTLPGFAIRTTCIAPSQTGSVYAVALSPNGSRIVTGGADFTVRLFNGQSGLEIASRPPTIGSVLALQYSPDGNTILVGGGDGTAKILNATSLAINSSLAGHSGLVYASRFSKDGKRVVTGSTDFTARVWNIERIGNVSDESDNLFRIIGSTGTGATIDFGSVALGSGTDKSSNAVSSLGSDPLTILGLKIADGDTNDFEILFTGTPNSIQAGTPLPLDISFTPTQLGARTANLDVATGTGVVRVRLNGTGTNPSLLAPSVVDFGRRVANQSVVDTIITLRMPSGATQPISVTTSTLTGAQSGAYTIRSGGGSFTLNPGESRSVAIRYEPTDFGRFAAQLVLDVQGRAPVRIRLYGEGTGDGRIATTTTLLFPTNPCGGAAGKATIEARNFGNTQLQIFSVGFEGNNADEFSVTPSQTFPISVEPSNSVTFTIAFNPLRNGTKDAKVVLTSSAVNAVSGRSVIPISARQDSVGFELSRPVVDFGNVGDGESSFERLLILNTGTVALRWPRTSITVGRFRIENINPEITQPGQRSEFTVRFLGGSSGSTFSESYEFVDSICGNKETLLMRATVKDIIVCSLSVARVDATIGTEVSVPVYVTNKVNFDRTNATQFQVYFSVNGTILTPASPTPAGTFESGGTRRFMVTVPIPTQDSLAATLRFVTTWGSDTSSIIKIDSVVTTDTIVVRTQNGHVRLTDICREGGARLFRLVQQSVGVRVAPMPVENSGTLVLSLVEQGMTTLDLIDISGRVVQKVHRGSMQGGTWFMPFDITDIPNGTYFLVLSTPTERVTERIEVLR